MRRTTLPALALWLLAVSPPALAVEGIEWNLDNPQEVISVVNFEPGAVENGRLSGWTAWDPHFSLRAPKEGIGAGKITWLTVRMYSSAEADLLDVYYESPDKRWCLGGKFPIARGWATYRMDLTKNNWRETRTGDASKQWGGPAKRVSSFRIDPGNQEGRWVMIDYVKLEALVASNQCVEGVTVEPQGTATLSRLDAPKEIEAGKTLPVSAEFDVTAPKGLTQGTAFLRLRHGATIMRLVEQGVAFGDKKVRVAADLPISAYWYPGALTVEAGCYELDPAKDSPAAWAEVSLTNSRVGKGKPPECKLKAVGGDPAILLNGEPLPGMMSCTAGGLHLECHREIALTGIHLYSDWFGTSRYSDLGHVAPETYDYGEYDRYFAAVLDTDPQACFLPHVGVTGPLWWQKEHPDELCRLEDGTKWPPSFASELWKKEMGEDLKKLIHHLRKAPYADRIIGYIVFNGYTAEWQMWGTWQPSRDDYSPPALKAFREFLKKRYGSDEKLRTAWNDPAVALSAAEMPRWDKRRPGGPQVLRDPKTERPAMDFYEFISHMDADALLYFARIARDATEGKALIGTYYGYLTAHGINQQDSGHLAARRVFDSRDIDFLMSPPNYWYRKPGEACTFMSATDSLRLRGKLWLDESDNRTFLSDPSAGYGRADTLEETLGVYWREFAEVLTKRAAVSWFDMAGGWFSHPRILSDMAWSYQIMKEGLATRKPFAPEIGVFVDPESFYWMRSTAANAALDLNQVATMPQSGAPWDFLLLSDIGDNRVPDYRLYVFLNAFYVDKPLREAIQKKLRRNNATALFVYAPGYFGPDGPSLENMQALTGIKIAKDDGEGKPQLLLDDKSPLLVPDFLSKSAIRNPQSAISSPLLVGAEKLTISPIFYAPDPDARIVGRLVDGARPGLVVKTMDGWTSIYSGAMTLPPALMRAIAREAGVHIWLETDDALYTDGQFVGLHAATDGEKRLVFPSPCEVFDAFTGKPLPASGNVVILNLKRAETALVQLRPLKE